LQSKVTAVNCARNGTDITGTAVYLEKGHHSMDMAMPWHR